MWQFINGSSAAFAELEERARHACVRFPDQPMPLGADPARAAIGFEVDPQTGAAWLLVDRGVRYTGPNNEIRSWFLDGQRSFESFTALRSWLATILLPALLPTRGPVPSAAVLGPESEDDSELDLDELDRKILKFAARQERKKDDLPS